MMRDEGDTLACFEMKRINSYKCLQYKNTQKRAGCVSRLRGEQDLGSCAFEERRDN